VYDIDGVGAITDLADRIDDKGRKDFVQLLVYIFFQEKI
jgi:hypothetical protein